LAYRLSTRFTISELILNGNRPESLTVKVEEGGGGGGEGGLPVWFS
jgi:hypothetical protein